MCDFAVRHSSEAPRPFLSGSVFVDPSGDRAREMSIRFHKINFRAAVKNYGMAEPDFARTPPLRSVVTKSGRVRLMRSRYCRAACASLSIATSMLGTASAHGTAEDTRSSAESEIAAESAEAAPSQNLEEVLIYGRGEKRIGTASAASEGAIAGADLSVRPQLRVAELLEAVPGLIAAQHSGSGKANQYFLRGFNLDHGTDFTTYVDDMPWNFRTHGHGQGYLDVNGLIPEIVNRIDYRTGVPISAAAH
jgi:hypothetical protein